jgi:hypothetical protein
LLKEVLTSFVQDMPIDSVFLLKEIHILQEHLKNVVNNIQAGVMASPIPKEKRKVDLSDFELPPDGTYCPDPDPVDNRWL